MEHNGGFLQQGLIFLVAALVAVPLFKRLGLGSVLGYLVAGMAIGPWGLRLIGDPQTVLHVAEHAQHNRPDRTEVPGWRTLAITLGIPPWQARRVTVLLLGAPGWPGLAERWATGGPAALRGPAIEAAVRTAGEVLAKLGLTPPKA